MANERLSMRNLREILRHKLELRHKHRDIGRALGISAGTVGETVVRAKVLGLDWATICTLDDIQLETRMYGPRAGHHSARPPPNLPYIHTELRRAGVTLQVCISSIWRRIRTAIDILIQKSYYPTQLAVNRQLEGPWPLLPPTLSWFILDHSNGMVGIKYDAPLCGNVFVISSALVSP